jgi:hypothetical protein
LKGDQGQRIWTGCAILAYNLDPLALHTTDGPDRRHQPTTTQPASGGPPHLHPLIREK